MYLTLFHLPFFKQKETRRYKRKYVMSQGDKYSEEIHIKGKRVVFSRVVFSKAEVVL